MTDDELDAKLAQLPESYEAEFDIERGLERLRAAGYGFRATSDSMSDLSLEVASSGPAHAAAAAEMHGTDLRAASVRLREPVVLHEGIALGSGEVHIDAAKLEGAPTEASMIALSRRPLSADEKAMIAPPGGEHTASSHADEKQRSTRSDLFVSSAIIATGAATTGIVPLLLGSTAAVAVTCAAMNVVVMGYYIFLDNRATRSKSQSRKETER